MPSIKTLAVGVLLSLVCVACSLGGSSVTNGDDDGSAEVLFDPNGVRIMRPNSSTVGVQQDEALVDVELIAQLDAQGRLPADVEVGCAGGFFPAEALQDIPPFVGSDFAEVEVVVTEFFATPESAGWPQDRWRVLYATDQRVLLVQRAASAAAGADDSSVAIMSFERDLGPWRLAGGQPEGRCDLHTPLGSGPASIDWELDPNAVITSDSTVIFTLVTERGCTGGEPLGDLLVGPDVVITNTQILVAYAARPRSGTHPCNSNPASSVVIRLPMHSATEPSPMG